MNKTRNYRYRHFSEGGGVRVPKQLKRGLERILEPCRGMARYVQHGYAGFYLLLELFSG